MKGLSKKKQQNLSVLKTKCLLKRQENVCFPYLFFLHLTSVPVRFFVVCFCFPSVAICHINTNGKSCRLVLQRAPVGSISVNTTFHLEPPAGQACLSAHLFLASCFFSFFFACETNHSARSGSRLKHFFSYLFLEDHNCENKSLRSVTSSTTSGELVELRMWSQDRFSDKDSFIKLSELPTAAAPWPWHVTRNLPWIPGVSDRVLKACRFIVTITWLSVSSFHPVLPDCRTSLQQLSSFL